MYDPANTQSAYGCMKYGRGNFHSAAAIVMNRLGKGASPYLSSEPPDVIIQLREVLLVVAAEQHDTNEVCQRVLHDVPIPRRCLGVSHKDVGGEPLALGSDLRIEELACHLSLIQKEWQIPLLTIRPHTGQDFARPR